MDPNATLRVMESAITHENWVTLRYSAKDLNRWIVKGGFQPDWKQCPNAFAYYLGRFGHDGINSELPDWHMGDKE